MLPDTSADRWVRTAWTAWAVLLLVVCGHAALRPAHRSLYPTYAAAGADWLAGTTAYRPHIEPPLDVYRYSPLFSVLMVPWQALPDALGAPLWRLFNGGALLAALAWWLRAAAPEALSPRQAAWVFLLVLPLAPSSLQNGQPNPLLMALLLTALTAAGRERWNLAAAAVALASVIKIYPLAFGLLLAAVYPRRCAGRLVLALAAVLLLPFLLQRPAFVLAEYHGWYERLRPVDEARRTWPLRMSYRDLWLLFRVANMPITTPIYQGLQLATAAGCALLAVLARWRGWPLRRVLCLVLTLGSCWIILCGPATESCTFILLAPALAWQVVAGEGGPVARGLTWAGWGVLMVAVLAGLSRQASHLHGWGPHPLGALLFTAGCLTATLRALARRAPPGLPAAAPPARAA